MPNTNQDSGVEENDMPDLSQPDAGIEIIAACIAQAMQALGDVQTSEEGPQEGSHCTCQPR